MAFFRRKQPEAVPYDPARQRPAVRRSVCTGEMTAGFIDRETGKFRELMLLEGREGLEAFCRGAGVQMDDVEIFY